MAIGIDGRGAFWYKGRGIGVYTRGIIRALWEGASLDCKILTPYGWENSEKALRKIENTDSFRVDFWESIGSKEIVLPQDIEVYHNPYNGMGFLPENIPTVVTIHDLIPFVMPQFCGEPYGTLFREKMTNITEKAEKIIAVSHRTAEDLQEILQVSVEKIKVIYESPSPLFFPRPKDEVREIVQKKFSLTLPYILYAGGFNERKNVKGLLKAFGEYRRKFCCQCLLVLVGDDSRRRQNVVSFAKENGYLEYVRFLDNISDTDLAFLYCGSKFTVYPSFYEGFGLPPLEAAACGKAVLCADTSSLPEIMGEGAVYANPYCIDDLGRKMTELVNNPQYLKEMSLKAYRHSRNFSKEKEGREIISVYKGLCR